MVQHIHLRYGDQHAMTLITFQDGKVVMRDGKVGTGQECCCDGEVACCVEVYEMAGGFDWEPHSAETIQNSIDELCALGAWDVTATANPPYVYGWVYTKKPCSQCPPFETDVPRDDTGLGTGFGGGPFGTNPRGLVSRYCVPRSDDPAAPPPSASDCLSGCSCFSLEEMQAFGFTGCNPLP